MKIRSILFVCIAIWIASCGTATKPASTADAYPNVLEAEPWGNAANSYIRAEGSNDKAEKAKHALEGISHAEECIMKNPENAACYYYRAMNTGIYYSAHVTGYQNGLKTMAKDCEKVISLDDKFDHGGAYRTLGKIYTSVPEIALTKNGIRQDLDKAIHYLKKAVEIDGTYPENHIYLAQAFLETGKKEEALASFSNAAALVPQWKNHRDYTQWIKMNKELSKKIK